MLKPSTVNLVSFLFLIGFLVPFAAFFVRHPRPGGIRPGARDVRMVRRSNELPFRGACAGERALRVCGGGVIVCPDSK